MIFSPAKSQGKTYAGGDRSQRDFADSSNAGRNLVTTAARAGQKHALIFPRELGVDVDGKFRDKENPLPTTTCHRCRITANFLRDRSSPSRSSASGLAPCARHREQLPAIVSCRMGAWTCCSISELGIAGVL